MRGWLLARLGLARCASCGRVIWPWTVTARAEIHVVAGPSVPVAYFRTGRRWCSTWCQRMSEATDMVSG